MFVSRKGGRRRINLDPMGRMRLRFKYRIGRGCRAGQIVLWGEEWEEGAEGSGVRGPGREAGSTRPAPPAHCRAFIAPPSVHRAPTAEPKSVHFSFHFRPHRVFGCGITRRAVPVSGTTRSVYLCLSARDVSSDVIRGR
ncbi:unnamed protein product [Danaus chrysippus]|uniref:(African queen) hypothetical protein n=1 Tax=Danaus chrysippus TaxID=151541 RepID=A0A8J2WA90_9NEOP|nr:unnamed protein product [Danaus chrysippus]